MQRDGGERPDHQGDGGRRGGGHQRIAQALQGCHPVDGFGQCAVAGEGPVAVGDRPDRPHHQHQDRSDEEDCCPRPHHPDHRPRPAAAGDPAIPFGPPGAATRSAARRIGEHPRQQQRRHDHHDLQHRQRDRLGNPEVSDGLRVDLGLQGPQLPGAENDHDAETGGTEQEDQRGRRRRGGHQARHDHGHGRPNPARPERPCRLEQPRVEVAPGRADDADDDGDVDEHVRREHGRQPGFDVQERQWAGQQRTEGDTDDDRRQHEWHGHHDGEHDRGGPADPGEQPRDGCGGGERQDRRGGRLAQGDAQKPQGVGTVEQFDQAHPGVTGDRDGAPDERDHRPGEQHHDEQRRDHPQRNRSGGPGHPGHHCPGRGHRVVTGRPRHATGRATSRGSPRSWRAATTTSRWAPPRAPAIPRAAGCRAAPGRRTSSSGVLSAQWDSA